ncbi:MAG: cytochrome c biosis protein CcmG, thiol:disulfide interchange protein DsbE [Actinomycetota bacterium]|jgi:cytochrome c biogenesis protein CcmG/thiol:disulfide interchange protein DsbE|nr:cytochrome c biosis protein CcmG, thiol:disulfide interchange protein DsbE [Actinomycetota bacterium]
MEELFSRDRTIPKGMLILAPAVIFLIVIGMGTYKRSDVPTAGKEVPSFSAPLLVADGQGDRFGSEDLAGKPYFLNFWASWCAPCEDEAPLLDRAYEEYGDRIGFLGIDIRDARSDALEFVTDHGLGYPSIRDEDMRIYATFGLTGQPESFFVDADGVLVKHVPGPVTEEMLFQTLDVLVRRDA